MRGPLPAVEGIDHALCVRRTALDAALVETAREAGADVRERERVTALVHDDAGRVAGVRHEGPDGRARELRAPLVIGADGRRSTVARLVGADVAQHQRASGRACFYGYWLDARPELRHVAAQWREDDELGTAFPCDDGLVLVLLQTPAARAAEFRARPRRHLPRDDRRDPRACRAARGQPAGEQGPQRDGHPLLLPAFGRTGLGAGR